MISGNMENILAPIRTISGKVDVIDTSTEAQSGKAVRLEGCAVGTELEVKLSSNTVADFTNLGTRKSRNLIDTKSGISYIKYLTTAGAERARYGWILDFPPGDYIAHAENINYTGGYIYLYIIDKNNQCVGDPKYLANGSVLQVNAGRFTLAEGQRALLLDYTTSHTQENAEKLLYEDINLQVETGTLPTAYEPYGEKQVGAEVLQYGKNLFDYSKYPLVNYYWNRNTGILVTSNSYSCSMLMPCKHLQGKTIAQNEAVYDVATAGNGGVVFFTDNTAEGFIEGTSTNGHIYTVPNNAVYMGVTVPRAFADGTAVQIEIGESVTDFEQFKEPQVFTADAGGNVAGVTAYSTNTLIVSDNDNDITLTASYSIEVAGDTYTNKDKVKSIQLDRVAENKFFGFGICQKATVVLVDKDCTCGLAADDKLTITFDDTKISPLMYITDVKRNEINNELTVTAYDALNGATAHTVRELALEGYTVAELVEACAALLKTVAVYPNIGAFGLVYEEGANFDGTETIRAVLDAVAEATQTIYFINRNNELTFMRLDKDGAAVLTIDKSQYMTLDNKASAVLTDIVNITDLGDNIAATTGFKGSAQNIYNNPLLDLREDAAEVLQSAIADVGGTEAQQYNLTWRGNYLLEPCDKISITTKDGSIITSYLLGDSITYTGGFKQVSKWEFNPQEKGSANPTTLGEAIKQTYARVDKANKDIELLVSETKANSSAVSALQLNEKSINATVTDLQKTTSAVSGEIETLTQKVSAQLTAEDVKLEIAAELENGVSKVETTTGFTFNEQGLTVSKTNSEISTTITETGMQVKKGGTEVLTANNEGVRAEDLHATTFLIIGNNSRLEDMGNRTACFWIGKG